MSARRSSISGRDRRPIRRPTALWMNLAKAHRLAGDDEAERAALEQALAIDQLHLMALIRLAELHERRGELGAATDRWTMVLGLCAQIPNPTPQLNAMIGHARAFVAERQQALAEAVEDDLAAALGYGERTRSPPRIGCRGPDAWPADKSSPTSATAFSIPSCRPTSSSIAGISRGWRSWKRRRRSSARNWRRSWRARIRALRPTSKCRPERRTICGASSTIRPTGARFTCGATANGSTRCASGRRERRSWSSRCRWRTFPGRRPRCSSRSSRPARPSRRTPASPTSARSFTCR